MGRAKTMTSLTGHRKRKAQGTNVKVEQLGLNLKPNRSAGDVVSVKPEKARTKSTLRQMVTRSLSAWSTPMHSQHLTMNDESDSELESSLDDDGVATPHTPNPNPYTLSKYKSTAAGEDDPGVGHGHGYDDSEMTLQIPNAADFERGDSGLVIIDEDDVRRGLTPTELVMNDLYDEVLHAQGGHGQGAEDSSANSQREQPNVQAMHMPMTSLDKNLSFSTSPSKSKRESEPRRADAKKELLLQPAESTIAKHIARLSGKLSMSAFAKQLSPTNLGSPQQSYSTTEQRDMDLAMEVDLKDFVTLTCRAIHSILSLNYQSVQRFRKTPQWNEFQDAVGFRDLINKDDEQQKPA